jgi:Divergent InlB B-repeat domain/Bacterial Ig domain
MVAACGGGGDSASGSSGLSLQEAGSERTEQLKAVQHRLTVSSTGGQGQIFTTAGGVDCGPNCTADFDAGTVVKVRAVPAPGFSFVEWEEAHCGPNDIVCEVTMSGPRTVTARFAAVSPLAMCDVTRSNASTPTIAPARPRIMFNNAEFKDCMQRKFAHQAPEAMRMKAFVDGVMAGGSRADWLPWYAALVYQATGDERYARFAVQSMDDMVKVDEEKIANGVQPTLMNGGFLHSDGWLTSIGLVMDWVPHSSAPDSTTPGGNNQLTPGMRARWIALANASLQNIWYAQADQVMFGGHRFNWSTWGRNNPYNNFYYHFLSGTMHVALGTLGENPRAQEWIDYFRIQKMDGQVFPMMRDLKGGGSREGTAYGTTTRLLSTVMDAWERSTGERLANKTPYPLASLAHQIHNIVPTLDRMTPTGDQPRDHTASLYDYQRDQMNQSITLFPNEPIAGVAKKLLAMSSVPRQQYGRDEYSDVLYGAPKNTPERDLSTLSTTYWGEGTGQLMMRSDWSTTAAFSNFTCGPLTESHAHFDQGGFQIFRGDWLAHDANLRSANGLAQAQENHNVVRLKNSAGVQIRMMESPPAFCRTMALADNPTYTYISADITPSYSFRRQDLNHLDNHLVRKLNREYLFIRPSTFVVMDRVETSEATQQIWSLNLPSQPTMQDGKYSMTAGANSMDVFAVSNPSGAATTLTSQTPTTSRGTNWRVEVANTGLASHFLNVIGTNGSVVSATPSNTDGKLGARIELADGRVATVRFPTAQMGGELEIASANGTVLTTGPLPKTIGEPALYAADAPPPVRSAPPPYDPGATPPPPANPPPTTPAPPTTPPPPGNPPTTPPPASAPDASLPASMDGNTFLSGAAVTIPVTLSSQVDVARVELLRNGTKVAEVTAAPYTFVVTDLPVGNHKLEARVVHTNGSTKTSPAVEVRTEAPAPAPTGNVVTLRQGLNGYASVVDMGMTSQSVTPTSPRGSVYNDPISLTYRVEGSSGYEARTFVRFGGLSSLAGRRVVKAELALSFVWGSSGYVLNGKYLTVPWNPASGAYGWTSRTLTSNWAQLGSGGSDWVTNSGFQLSGFQANNADVRKALLDPAIVQGWIDNPQTNNGFVLTPANLGAVSRMRTSEDTTANFRPTLQITFE